MPTNDTYRGARENRAMPFRLYLLKSVAWAWAKPASFAVDVLEKYGHGGKRSRDHGVSDAMHLITYFPQCAA